MKLSFEINDKAVVFSFSSSSDEAAEFEKFVDFSSVFDAEFLSSADLLKSVVFSDKEQLRDFVIKELDYVDEDDQETVNCFVKELVDLEDVSSYTVLSINVASEQDYLIVIINN